MKSNVIVIIACEELCKGLRYAGMLDYQKARTVDYVGFYLCGAVNKDDVSVFIENLLNSDECSAEQKNKMEKVLGLVKKTNAEPIDEDFKLFVTHNMYQLDFNSWKCMPELMDSDCYLVLPFNEWVDCPVVR